MHFSFLGASVFFQVAYDSLPFPSIHPALPPPINQGFSNESNLQYDSVELAKLDISRSCHISVSHSGCILPDSRLYTIFYQNSYMSVPIAFSKLTQIPGYLALPS